MFVATTAAQLNFGPSSSSTSAPNAPGQDLKTRNNFLQDIFGTNQGGNNFNQGGNNFNQGGNNFNQGNSNFNQGNSNFNQGNSFCCCVPLNDQCGDPLGRYIEELDLVGDGLINPRLKPFEEEATKRTSQRSASIIPRIVNNPNVAETAPLTTCPSGQKACCYDPSVDQSFLGRSCISPGSSQVGRFENVQYGCNERVVSSRKECGTRNFPAPSRNLQHGEASPGEFPWTCLILNGNNDFIGSCAIIPNDSSNNNGRGTRKVVTAAHKLKNVQQNEFLKIRVGEYDACTGDGGSPLVCQGLSGRWTVVGLVTWGVGCASDVPGVYARMSHFTQWINEN